MATKFAVGDKVIRLTEELPNNNWKNDLRQFTVIATRNWHGYQEIRLDQDKGWWDGYRFFLVSEKSTQTSDNPLDEQVGGDHYKTLSIQPIEYIIANKLGWCEGNIVKYITRWKQKNGTADIDKVIHYAQLLKQMESKNA